MNHKQFFDLVCSMRKAQKTYFKTRSTSALQESKYLEKQVDVEIKRVNEILNNGPSLFDINESSER